MKKAVSRQVDALNLRTGCIVRELREKSGMTQKDLGTLLGLAASSISRIENGRQGLLISDLFTITRHFKLPFEHFLGEE